MTHSYLVIYERAEDGTVSAYAPELQPGGVISTGSSYEEARTNITAAIALWVEEMRSSGRSIPASPIRYELLEVAS
jgi:predicted RNase H-like HicB family nuclease